MIGAKVNASSAGSSRSYGVATIVAVTTAAAIGVRTSVTSYALEDVATALDDLRHGRVTGAAVVVP